ncbi:MAG: prolipoprotein diacylglyceryl transferase [Phycisphaerae bacterium]|nr:prolipoprotein diacylglyceryl transferase [Phycisphaerae bacterium]
MHPELFTIPIFNRPATGYGFMLMLGFLSAIWIGMRRAERVKANPDVILNCGIFALFGGVGGARIFYVVHYWETMFAYQDNVLWSALNCTSGGLEYLGGLIGAISAVAVYVVLHGRLFARGEQRLSLRLYLDLLAPVAMWGLAFGRMGCFLNGCCWGGLCVDEHNHKALPWAVSFPYSSGPHERQWENRQVTVPAELIWDDPRAIQVPMLIPRKVLEATPESERVLREYQEINSQYLAEKAKGANSEEFKKLEARWKRLQARAGELSKRLRPRMTAQQYPSRQEPSRPITLSELEQLSRQYRSSPVHPAQLYALVNALLLYGVLVLIFNRRKRHGVVLGWMLLLYPIARFVLELIRVDNPYDTGGMTISQAFGVAVFVCGLIWMLVLYKLQPLRSPFAQPWIPPEEEPGKPT